MNRISAKDRPTVIRLKVTTVGMPQVGKSCLIKNYCEGRFVRKYLPTIGVDYGVRPIEVDKCTVRVNFFDLSGLDDYTDIRAEFYGDTQGLILIFDLSKKETFLGLDKYHREFLKATSTPTQLFLIGTKADQPPAVTPDEIKAYSTQIKAPFFRVSSQSGEGVTACFESIFRAIFDKVAR